MARVTVEDCLENVENRFKLVMISTHRARQRFATRGGGCQRVECRTKGPWGCSRDDAQETPRGDDAGPP